MPGHSRSADLPTRQHLRGAGAAGSFGRPRARRSRSAVSAQDVGQRPTTPHDHQHHVPGDSRWPVAVNDRQALGGSPGSTSARGHGEVIRTLAVRPARGVSSTSTRTWWWRRPAGSWSGHLTARPAAGCPSWRRPGRRSASPGQRTTAAGRKDAPAGAVAVAGPSGCRAIDGGRPAQVHYISGAVRRRV